MDSFGQAAGLSIMAAHIQPYMVFLEIPSSSAAFTCPISFASLTACTLYSWSYCLFCAIFVHSLFSWFYTQSLRMKCQLFIPHQFFLSALRDKVFQGVGQLLQTSFPAALHIVSCNPTTKKDMEGTYKEYYHFVWLLLLVHSRWIYWGFWRCGQDALSQCPLWGGLDVILLNLWFFPFQSLYSSSLYDNNLTPISKNLYIIFSRYQIISIYFPWTILRFIVILSIIWSVVYAIKEIPSIPLL